MQEIDVNLVDQSAIHLEETVHKITVCLRDTTKSKQQRQGEVFEILYQSIDKDTLPSFFLQLLKAAVSVPKVWDIATLLNYSNSEGKTLLHQVTMIHNTDLLYIMHSYMDLITLETLEKKDSYERSALDCFKAYHIDNSKSKVLIDSLEGAIKSKKQERLANSASNNTLSSNEVLALEEESSRDILREKSVLELCKKINNRTTYKKLHELLREENKNKILWKDMNHLLGYSDSKGETILHKVATIQINQEIEKLPEDIRNIAIVINNKVKELQPNILREKSFLELCAKINNSTTYKEFIALLGVETIQRGHLWKDANTLLNYSTSNGETLLHRAATINNIEIAKVVINNMMSINNIIKEDSIRNLVYVTFYLNQNQKAAKLIKDIINKKLKEEGRESKKSKRQPRHTDYYDPFLEISNKTTLKEIKDPISSGNDRAECGLDMKLGLSILAGGIPSLALGILACAYPIYLAQVCPGALDLGMEQFLLTDSGCAIYCLAMTIGTIALAAAVIVATRAALERVLKS